MRKFNVMKTTKRQSWSNRIESFLYEAKPYACVGFAVWILALNQHLPFYGKFAALLLVGCGAIVLKARHDARRRSEN